MVYSKFYTSRFIQVSRTPLSLHFRIISFFRIAFMIKAVLMIAP